MNCFNRPPRRAAVAVLFAFTVVGLGVGLHAFWPYLVREHRRQELWKSLVAWAGYALALAWFLQFCLVHSVLRQPCTPVPRDRTSWMAIISILCMLAIDIFLIQCSRSNEKDAYRRAVVTVGELRELRKWELPKKIRYRLDCRSLDGQGGIHEVVISLRLNPEEAVPLGLCRDISDASLAHRSIGIAYDPTFPERCWVEGAGWDDVDRLHNYLSMLLIVQVTGVGFLMIAAVQGHRRQFNRLPWWYDLYKGWPVLSAAFLMMMLGLMEWLLQRFQ
jgi:hypothetical protein